MFFQIFKDFLQDFNGIFPARPVELPLVPAGMHLSKYLLVFVRADLLHNGPNLLLRQVQGDEHLLGSRELQREADTLGTRLLPVPALLFIMECLEVVIMRG